MPMLIARSGHTSVRSLAKYARVSADADGYRPLRVIIATEQVPLPRGEHAETGHGPMGRFLRFTVAWIAGPPHTHHLGTTRPATVRL
jgi:hypothetical protein